MIPAEARIYIAGHQGLVGSALMRRLGAAGHRQTITRTRSELDLTNQAAVEGFFTQEKPEYVILAAARVGGIHANDTCRADFIYQNLMMAANVIHAAWRHQTRKLLFLGSSCIYPRLCPQPMKEEYLLSGPLEPTNEPYAIAKIAGLKLVESYNRQHGTNFISVMPTNLYGPEDNFDLQHSHVLPAMMRKFHEAKMAGHIPVTLWGSGKPRREFLHVDDLAAACVQVLTQLDAGTVPGDLINIGCGNDLTIQELALLVQRVVGHQGTIQWDASKPDGTPRKLLDTSRIQALGWQPQIILEQGLTATYQHFLAHLSSAKGL